MTIKAPVIEIHSAEIADLVHTYLAASCAYAATLDEIADVVLDDRMAFNAYLDEFDRFLERLTGYTAEISGSIHAATNGKKAFCDTALRIPLVGYSVRSAQIANAFAGADDVIRSASYQLLREEIQPENYDRIVARVVKEMRRAVRGIAKVHGQCLTRAEELLEAESSIKIGRSLTPQDRKRQRPRYRRINPADPAFLPG